MCLRLAWRKEEGSTHRVSQACPEHEPCTSTTHTNIHTLLYMHTCRLPPSPSTPIRSDTDAQQCTCLQFIALTHTQTFTPAIIKFMQTHTGHVHFSPSVPVRLKTPQLHSLTRHLVSQKTQNTEISLLPVCIVVIFLKPPHVNVNMTVFAYRSTLSQVCWARFFLMYSSSGADVMEYYIQGTATNILYVICKCMSQTLTLKIFKLETYFSCTLLQVHVKNTH